MTDTPHAGRGSIITYLDDSDPENGQFRRAVVIGPTVADPETADEWLPVVRADCEVTLVDPALIVANARAGAENGPRQDAVYTLATALAALAGGMTEVDEQAPMAMLDTRDLLNRFVDAIAPIEYALYLLVEADPHGVLATVLSWIGTAADEFEHGHVADGKAGIMLAHSAMAELVPHGPDET
jgi:hypothetical protein